MEKKNLDIDAGIIEKCREGDRMAQYEIYRRYSKTMFNVAIRMSGDRYQAEDVLQESFFQAFDKIDQFKGESDFGQWLKRIVINNCIDKLRKKKIQFEELDKAIVNSSGYDEIESMTDAGLVHEIIKTLPEGARQIFVMVAMEGYKHKEVSEVLSISESTSKSQFIRAKMLLVKQLT